MISTILLLPHADTRERLLAPHAPVWIPAEPYFWGAAEFGTMVDPATPGVDDDDDDAASDIGERIKVSWPSLGVCGAVASALHLVLARDGAVVPEGVDRLRRVALSTAETYTPTDVDIRALLTGEAVIGRAQWLSRMQALGTLVLLDSSGSEVSP